MIDQELKKTALQLLQENTDLIIDGPTGGFLKLYDLITNSYSLSFRYEV